MLRKVITIMLASVLVFNCITVVFATGDDMDFLPSDVYKQGDVNMDNNINVRDVILELKHIVGNMTLDSQQSSLADMDSNGNVTVKDAIFIQRAILNADDTPVEKPTIPDEDIDDDKPIELPFVPAV